MQNKLCFGVIGNPIAHSKSPHIHNLWFKEFNLNYDYKAYLEDTLSLQNRILSLKGANITVPFKEEVLQYADICSDEVKIIKAANTIVNDNGIIKAYNTDFYGFIKALQNYDFKRVLLLGVGGAARACAYALMKNNIDFTVFNRSKKEDFICKVENELYEFNFDVVVNCTSSSLTGQLPCSIELLNKLKAKAKIVYDLFYTKSVFLEYFENAIKIDGKLMLLYQAALAAEYFYNIKISDELVKKSEKIIF
ncbi:shikimate dehydrogenase [Campylobacter canadensis]|uniref:shikimate dehydrogenase n=1 Tax=Campylobacter canadensis TaxID=449520 RepID=UPI00155295ED|nr:shikimate dehydrogenase [Campylobacter canadensis]